LFLSSWLAIDSESFALEDKRQWLNRNSDQLTPKKSWPKTKNPGQLNCPGFGGELEAHAVGLRRRERNRLSVRWEQVIAPGFAGVGYPVESDLLGQLQIKPESTGMQRKLFNHTMACDCQCL
jgi:hypothetical protein